MIGAGGTAGHVVPARAAAEIAAQRRWALNPDGGARTAEGRPDWWLSVGGRLILVLLIAGLVVARLEIRGDAIDRVWAEDGKVFLGDVDHHGLGSIFYVYSGYLNLAQRLIALGAYLLPLRGWAPFTVVASALVAGMLGAFVHAAASRFVNPYWALLPALSVALMPALGSESLGSLADLSWPLVFAAFWALTGPSTITATVVGALAALTTPLTVLLLPAAVVTHGRRAWRHPPALAIAGGTLAQFVATLLAPRSPGGVARHPSISGVIPQRLFHELIAPAAGPGWGRTIVGLAAFAGLLVLAWRGYRHRMAVVTAAAGLLVYLVAAVTTGDAPPRYVALAGMFLWGSLALLAPGLGRTGGWILVGLLVAYAVAGFPAAPYRLSGPLWSDALRASCQHGYAEVPVSPQGWGAVALRCFGNRPLRLSRT